MADSSLDPDNMPLPDRQLGKGHGTGALGPSDTSDSGSDMVGTAMGGMGDAEDNELDLDSNTRSGSDDTPFGTAGPDLGDANLDSDTDVGGTGERASAGRETRVADGRDIGTDHIEYIRAADTDIDDDLLEPQLRRTIRKS